MERLKDKLNIFKEMIVLQRKVYCCNQRGSGLIKLSHCDLLLIEGRETFWIYALRNLKIHDFKTSV